MKNLKAIFEALEEEEKKEEKEETETPEEEVDFDFSGSVEKEDGEETKDSDSEQPEATESELVTNTRSLIDSVLDALEEEIIASGDTIEEDESIDLGLELIHEYADKIPEEILTEIYNKISEYYEIEVDETQTEDEYYEEPERDEEIPTDEEDEPVPAVEEPEEKTEEDPEFKFESKGK